MLEPISKRPLLPDLCVSQPDLKKGLILEILNVFLWLKFLSSLTSNKIEHFETGSLLFLILKT